MNKDWCELWASGKWHDISIDQALSDYAERILRCPECHGAVKAFNAGPNGKPRAHFEHKARHPGCSRGDCFDGTQRPHPKPVRV